MDTFKSFFQFLLSFWRKQEIPWESRPSIYAFILVNTDQAGKFSPKENLDLPDEPLISKSGRVRFMAGAMDGISSHQMGREKDTAKSKETAQLILSIAKRDRLSDKIKLYQSILKDEILSRLDTVLQNLVTLKTPITVPLENFAKWLTTQAPDRSAVKLGIALLGVIGKKENLEIVQNLGKCDEFTLFSAVALQKMAPEPEMELWKLAKQLDGWGRIQIVERLEGTVNPQIQNWLLREGYKNSVMYEYLAYICAETGRLKEALSNPQSDDALLLSAGEIIEALITGGPARGIHDYQDAPQTLSLFLERVKPKANRLEDFLVVEAIAGYLKSLDSPDKFEKQGWTEEKRAALLKTCTEIKNQPQWKKRIEDGLSSESPHQFNQADRTAQILGLDTWNQRWKRLQAHPLESGEWYSVMKQANESRIEAIVSLAESALPLENIGRGPALDMGLGTEYKVHGCLDFILQELGKFPQKGSRLVAVGLKSPVIRNRNFALKVLSKWGEANWDQILKKALQEAAAAEPDEAVKKRIHQVLNGMPVS